MNEPKSNKASTAMQDVYLIEFHSQMSFSGLCQIRLLKVARLSLPCNTLISGARKWN